MVAFALGFGELYVLLHPQQRLFVHPGLGVIVAPHPNEEESKKLVDQIYSHLNSREDFETSYLTHCLELIDTTDVELYTKVTRYCEPLEPLDTTGFSELIIKSKVVENLPQYRTIRSVTGRKGDQYFTVIRDGGMFYFITETVKPGNIQQVVELLYHTIGRETPLMIDPININNEMVDELSQAKDHISNNTNLNFLDVKKINDLLSYNNTQKANIVLEAKSFTQSTSSPIAIGVVDFENKGRLVSKPYVSYDGTAWIKYLPGTDAELGKAILENAELLGIDWYNHQR